MANAKQPMCGEILKRLRLMRGIIQYHAARNAGYSQQYYSKIERGEKNISEEIFNHIVATNGYSADEIEVVKKFWSAPLTDAAVMF